VPPAGEILCPSCTRATACLYLKTMSDRVLHNPRTGETIALLTTSQESGGELFRMGYTMAPHAAIADNHCHPFQEMLVHVKSGTLTCTVDGVARNVSAGESLTIPAGAYHFQRNDTDREVTAVEEYRPAKHMQEFFEVLAGWANDGKTNAFGMPTPLRSAVMHRYFRDSIRSGSTKRNLWALLLAPIGLLTGCRAELLAYIEAGRLAEQHAQTEGK
jgi:quercetin dioxygenase-like cupin family protein